MKQIPISNWYTSITTHDCNCSKALNIYIQVYNLFILYFFFFFKADKKKKKKNDVIISVVIKNEQKKKKGKVTK